jgi:hypothetical protein
LDLLLDQIEVIQQPLGGRGDRPVWINRKRPAIKIAQDFFVPNEARQQPIRGVALGHPVQSSNYSGVTLKLLGTEQFCPKRRLSQSRRPRRLPFQRRLVSRGESCHTLMIDGSLALTSRNISSESHATASFCGSRFDASVGSLRNLVTCRKIFCVA